MQLGVLAALLALLVSALPGLGELRARFAEASFAWVALIVAVDAASVLAFIAVFRGVFCVRMSWRFSGQLVLSEQAVNVLLPAGGAGGLAFGAWALSQGGMSTGHIARRSGWAARFRYPAGSVVPTAPWSAHSSSTARRSPPPRPRYSSIGRFSWAFPRSRVLPPSSGCAARSCARRRPRACASRWELELKN